jgi:RNA polymerase-binding transcription factor DksA
VGVDRFTQKMLATRLHQCRENAEHQLDPGELGEDPLEKLWRRALRSQMREIEAALERLPGNCYGECESCGDSISLHRLYTVPWARQCFPCQTAQPQESATLLRCGAVLSSWY